jgi:ABC-type dipeptide/oligopeptide/nickel transport system permease subunit
MTDPTHNSRAEGLMADAWRRLCSGWLTRSCLAVVLAFTVLAGWGSVIYWRYHIIDATPTFQWMVPLQKGIAVLLRAESVRGMEPPYEIKNVDRQYEKPSREHWMGTDGLGRDVCARLVQGTRVAFQVGIITSLIAIPLAVFLGALAGFCGGKVDDIVVWLYSTFACMPSLLFILAVSLVVGKGLFGVYLGIGCTTWVGLCRLIRGEVMKHKTHTYVKAAQVLGFGRFRIIFRHILPNLTHLVIINFSLQFPSAISTEVIMSFLGLGVQDQPSWGLMLSSSRYRLWQGVWWELGFTTLAIFLIVLAFNILGDALRDALDPRLRSQGNA